MTRKEFPLDQLSALVTKATGCNGAVLANGYDWADNGLDVAASDFPLKIESWEEEYDDPFHCLTLVFKDSQDDLFYRLDAEIDYDDSRPAEMRDRTDHETVMCDQVFPRHITTTIWETAAEQQTPKGSVSCGTARDEHECDKLGEFGSCAKCEYDDEDSCSCCGKALMDDGRCPGGCDKDDDDGDD